jgi:hypothetical protein
MKTTFAWALVALFLIGLFGSLLKVIPDWVSLIIATPGIIWFAWRNPTRGKP